jgi:hypothetical protein
MFPSSPILLVFFGDYEPITEELLKSKGSLHQISSVWTMDYGPSLFLFTAWRQNRANFQAG